MKVILEAQHACTNYPRGIGRYTVSLIKHLLKRKKFAYELAYFDYKGGANNKKYISKYFGNFHVKTHECNVLHYYDAFIGEEKEFYEDYMSTQGDVFHFMHYIKFPKRINGATVVTAHDIMPLLFPQWFEHRIVEYSKIFAKKLQDTKPLILANSYCTKSDIVNYLKISDDDVIVIPHAYDKETCFHEKNKIWMDSVGINSPYFLYMGPIDLRKNIATLLKAFKLLLSDINDIQLVIAGVVDKYSSKAVFEAIRKFSPQERLNILGSVSDNERRYLFSHAEAFVFPSLYEGFGVPVLEAFACGCPVITSNVAALPEIAGDAAILINPNDAEEISFQMSRIVDNTHLRNRMIEQGFLQAKRFSWEKTAIMTEQAYDLAGQRKEQKIC